MSRSLRYQRFVLEARRPTVSIMRCKRVLSTQIILHSVFISAFACTIVLMVYIHNSTLPGQVMKPLRTIDYNISDLPVSVANLTTARPKMEDVANTDLLQIMDFQDLGINKKKVLLLIIVSTAPQRLERRQAIRDTWWKHCSEDNVTCVFITDGFIVDHVQRHLIIQEKNLYQDLELQPLLGGREFGLRFLNHIKWAMAKFDFEYLLRIDDDYFLCLKRLLSELPLRPKENLVWGHFHCEQGITWIDESFMLFSWDIIHKFLAQNESTMLCHPHADQQVGLWLNDIPTKLYFHDARLYHDPPASFSPQFEDAMNVCNSFLGLHGTYTKKMLYFGKNANDSAKDVLPLPKFSNYCRTTFFDHGIFYAPYRFDPKPCKDDPSWNLERKMFVGRENKH